MVLIVKLRFSYQTSKKNNTFPTKVFPPVRLKQAESPKAHGPGQRPVLCQGIVFALKGQRHQDVGCYRMVLPLRGDNRLEAR